MGIHYTAIDTKFPQKNWKAFPLGTKWDELESSNKVQVQQQLKNTCTLDNIKYFADMISSH